ncbi:MAG TPA: hypothetical protein VFA16_00640 [Mycobacterium sp.]|uniref:hypothetical protein n=1 Tax=Mycobacterium sp. TaxID=1785 RepID=UPI002D255E6B|nr:hypothetical protein [Mycobacterium sp.]HZU45755.1 hypothetical protein [Mycobacterium sp.]
MPTKHIADSCVLWSGFDVSIVARSYAQFTGILAGFAFVVINLVLDRAYRRRTDGHSPGSREVEHDTSVGIALVCGFLGLFLTCLRYSLLAGEQGCALTGGRAASVEVLAAVSFGASTYILLYAIVQFISGSAGVLAQHCVFMQTVLVPPMTVFFVEATLPHLAVALGDPQTQRPLQPFWDNATQLAIPISLVIVIICAAAWFAGIKRRRSESLASDIARTVRRFIPYITVAIVGAVIIRSIVSLPPTNPAAHIGPREAWLWLVLLCVAVVIQSTALSFQRSVEVPIITAQKDITDDGVGTADIDERTRRLSIKGG